MSSARKNLKVSGEVILFALFFGLVIGIINVGFSEDLLLFIGVPLILGGFFGIITFVLLETKNAGDGPERW